MEDRDIIRLYLQRSEAAIAETEQKYGQKLNYIAYSILGCREDCEEVANDTYLAAWSSIPPAEPENLASYLYRIARNTAIKKLREQKAEKRGGGGINIPLDEIREFVSSGDLTADMDDEIVITDILNKFLGSLEKEKRIIFTQRYWLLCSVQSIAENLGLGESNVKITLYRLRKKLKKMLESEGINL